MAERLRYADELSHVTHSFGIQDTGMGSHFRFNYSLSHSKCLLDNFHLALRLFGFNYWNKEIYNCLWFFKKALNEEDYKRVEKEYDAITYSDKNAFTMQMISWFNFFVRTKVQTKERAAALGVRFLFSGTLPLVLLPTALVNYGWYSIYQKEKITPIWTMEEDSLKALDCPFKDEEEEEVEKVEKE